MTVHCSSELISPVHRLPISMVPAMMSIVNQDTAGTALGNTYMGYLEVYCVMSCVPLHSYYYLIVGLFILTTVLFICRPHRTNPLWCGKSEHRALLPSLKATLPLWWVFEWLVLWAMFMECIYFCWLMYHAKSTCNTTSPPDPIPLCIQHTQVHVCTCIYPGMVMIFLHLRQKYITDILCRDVCVWWVVRATLTYTGEVLNHTGSMCFQISHLCVGYRNMKGSRCGTSWTEYHMHCNMECHLQHLSTKESFWSYTMHTLSLCVQIYTLWVWCPHRFGQVTRCLAYQPHHCSPYYYQLAHWTVL